MERVAVVLIACALTSPVLAEVGVRATESFPDLERWAAYYIEEESKFEQGLARRKYESLVKILPGLSAKDREAGLWMAADLARLIGENEDSKRLARTFLEEFPSSRRADNVWLGLAKVLEETAAPSREVVQAYQNAISRSDTANRSTARMVMSFGEYLSKMGELSQARKMLDRAARSLPDTASASSNILLSRIERQIKNLSVTGKPPPAFSAVDLSGRPQSPSAYKGKVLLIDFWAVWCGPCVNEIPTLAAVYEKYHKKGFELLGISLDPDTAPLEEFVKTRNLSWPQILDGRDGWESGLAALYGVKSIPANYLVNRRGEVVALNLRGPDVEPAVVAALAGRKISPRRPLSAVPTPPARVRSTRRRPAWDEMAARARPDMEGILSRISHFAAETQRYPVDEAEWWLRCGPVPVSPWGAPYRYIKTPDHPSFTVYCVDDAGRLAVEYHHNDNGFMEGFHVHAPVTRGRRASVKENLFWNDPYLENPMGHLAADALREVSGADIAFENALSLRGNFAAGVLTDEDFNRAAPWPGAHVVIEMSGGDLLDALPKALEPRWFLFASGLTGEISYQARGFSGNFFVGGAGVSFEKTYRVAVSRYLYEGGDQHPAFSGKKILKEIPLSMAEILKRHLAKHSRHAPFVPDHRARFEGHFRDRVPKMGGLNLSVAEE